MDNRQISITSQGDEHFKTALSLFCHEKVVGYRITADPVELVLYWAESNKCTPFAYDFTRQEAADFALGWLRRADYGAEPDIDGSCKKGWTMFCGAWGRIDGEWEAFVKITPAWAMYGK